MLNENNIIKLIKDFYKSTLPEPFYERDLELPLKLEINRAISIIGPRRVGKSYIMLLTIRRLIESGVKKSNILRINFEDPIFSTTNFSELKKIINMYFRIYPENTKSKFWLFLDEIQNVDGWERWVRSLLDNGNFKVYISGSSSKLLSKEIATQMRGRTISYTTYPLSFKEYLQFKKIQYSDYMSTIEENTIVKAVDGYIKFGGYPEVALMPKEKEKILREIVEVTVSRDIIERYKMRNPKVVRILINALANSQEFSANKFFNFLKSLGYKVSKNTIYAYMQALNDAFIVYYIKNYSKSYKILEQSIPKPFFVDNGILMANNVSDISKLMENLVFIKLLRMYGINRIYYAKSQSYDIDFIIAEKEVKQLIQVSYNIDNFATQDRELKSIYNASKNLNCNDLLIITWDREGKISFKGKKIKLLPIWKWLLY